MDCGMPYIFYAYEAKVAVHLPRYACVGDPSAENCDGNAISVCVSGSNLSLKITKCL